MNSSMYRPDGYEMVSISRIVTFMEALLSLCSVLLILLCSGITGLLFQMLHHRHILEMFLNDWMDCTYCHNFKNIYLLSLRTDPN
jgi:hypothetical protein